MSALLDSLDTSPLRGAALLDAVERFLARFIAYPSAHGLVAHVLWIVHTHLMDVWESTPRIAFLSPESGSGKTRALEVTEHLVPRPVHAVNTTPAYLFRKVSDESGTPTILFDEIDTIFGPKAQEHEDIRGMLNSGHRKGAVAGRCVVRGKIVETEEFPSYCAVAVAGLNDLPETIMNRSVVVRMRRRAPGENVEPWRHRINPPQATPLRDALAGWAASIAAKVGDPWPQMPAGVEDRDADVWEALLAVADAAGGEWPQRARDAATALVAASKDRAPSLGVLLLGDIRTVFADATGDRLPTGDLIAALVKLPEAPWSNLRGKELDARGLARRLAGYEIRSEQMWLDGKNVRGYDSARFADAWNRYLPTDAVLGFPPEGPASNARSDSPE